MALGVLVATPLAVAAQLVQIEAAEQVAAQPADGGLLLTASLPTAFEVYSITGQLVKRVEVEAGSEKVELPNGCYIVRCPRWSKKVIVK